MDDDIVVPSLDILYGLFESLKRYHCVGAHISGLVDDSILGHIATDVGIFNERMLSGGFMMFNPFHAEHYFLNNYNEDWIWLFLQLNGKEYLQTGEVFQTKSDPLDNYEGKILFQEFGEILLDGILDLYAGGLFDNLVVPEFWKRMLNERKEYLDTLLRLSQQNGKDKYIEVINSLKASSDIYEAVVFQNLFEKYFHNRDLFKYLFNSLS